MDTTLRAGQTMREGLGGTEVMVRGETAAETMAARVQAETYGAMMTAKRFPRDMGQVAGRILKECQRPGFAQTARYSVPRGDGKVTGFSIRFAEALMRLLGNINVTSTVVYDDTTKRIVSVRAVDLETNLTISAEVEIDKTVERKKLRSGQKAMGERVNSGGERVFIVEATTDDIVTKQAQSVSKAMRTCILRLTPADILEDAEQEIRRTIDRAFKQEKAEKPEDLRRRMIESFQAIGISIVDLKQFLGREAHTATPDDVRTMRDLYGAIKAGETTWADALAWRLDQDKGADDQGDKKPAESKP